ncbi:PNGase F N-terminal domain-containing protein [Persicobacter psychrovividus]|uniref:Peptide-N-glycosidase F N-terminal domain-containing protein n=1 Tax=Persicobacter psychrovividus TaxID=387638 RepID=A0ABN6LGN1_9BACT|nr:hypothetical protein PEPS_27720 [Persicobacter psychrovividus]
MTIFHKSSYIIGAVFCLLISCGPKEYPAVGNTELQLFDRQIVQFDPEIGDIQETGHQIELDNGRIVLTKVQIPLYERRVSANLHLTLQSNGDRWDKSGSVFMFPADQDINLIEIKKGLRKFPASAAIKEDFVGVLPAKGYTPAQELMRFMTPFGVGYYSQDTVQATKNRKPAYIAKWEDQVDWDQDITDRLPAVMGKEVYIGIWIDTWTKQGYKVSADISIKEAHLANDVRPQTVAIPLLNTIAYTGPQQAFDYLSRQPLTFDFEVPANLQDAQIKYLITGHGGHSGGDEFVKNPNQIFVDGQLMLDFTPWRDDCASFRRFNPGSGVWMEAVDSAQWLDWKKMEYVNGDIQERVASSDFSRSNWCPGSVVDPVEIKLGDLAQGKHQLKIALPNSQPTTEQEHNHWLISAYLVGELAQ